MAQPSDFPSYVRYRHSLWVIAFIPASLFLFGAATYSNYVQGSSWAWLWGGVCVVVPLAIIGRLLWLEKHGWWIRCDGALPALPAHFGTMGWSVTFDDNGLSATTSDVLTSPARTVAYAEIKRVDWEPGGRLQIVASGKVPLVLNQPREKDVGKIIALLSHHAPLIELAGASKAALEGWQPRL